MRPWTVCIPETAAVLEKVGLTFQGMERTAPEKLFDSLIPDFREHHLYHLEPEISDAFLVFSRVGRSFQGIQCSIR